MDKPEPVTGAGGEPPIGHRLKTAMNRLPVPPDLSERIRERIAHHDAIRRAPTPITRWLVGAAVVAVCTVSAWFTFAPERMPALSDPYAQDAYIRKITAMAPSVIRLGLGDHIHCAVFRKYPKNPPTLAEMATSLGPSYSGLLAAVQAAVTRDYRVVMAHHCGYSGRKFVHLTLSNGNGLMSLVVANKQGDETLSGLPPVIGHTSPPIYQASSQHYQVAAFEAGSQIAFVVSEMTPSQNLAMAEAMVADVRQVLERAKA